MYNTQTHGANVIFTLVRSGKMEMEEIGRCLTMAVQGEKNVQNQIYKSRFEKSDFQIKFRFSNSDLANFNSGNFNSGNLDFENLDFENFISKYGFW